MATQHGPIKLKGTIGDLTFFRNSDGTYGAKAKSGVSRERIATDPAFIRTRENGREFGNAGKSGKLLRRAFQTMIQGADKRMVGRMQQALMKCLKADNVGVRGKRTVAAGDLQLLKGFDFNVAGKLGTTLLAPYSCSINRATGQNTVTIPPFVPAVSLSTPQGATHFEIVAALAEMDFAAEAYATSSGTTGFLPVDNNATATTSVQVTSPANSTLPLLAVLAVHFYQEVNGQKYTLNNGGFDAVNIITVDA